MRSPDIFLERRELVEFRLGRRGELSAHRERDAGYGALTDSYRWAPLGAPPHDLPGELNPTAEQLVRGRFDPQFESKAETLARQLSTFASARGAAVEVFVYGNQQQVCVFTGGRPRQDTRDICLIELKVSAGSAPAIWRAAHFSTVDEALARIASLEARVAELIEIGLATGPAVPCPSDKMTVVFPPGAASGSFFHECCGHPLEGDVVLRRGSFLAGRLGEQVAPEFFSVVDDPVAETSGLRYRIDDEGLESEAVPLISRGVVAGVLLDERTARALDRRANGRGRRVSYRHRALPRMSHTAVAPGPHDPAETLAGVERGLWVQLLVPRQMNLLTGRFSFFIVEARLIENGKLGPFIAPGVLEGTALDALTGIDRVCSDAATMFSTRGCRKLDHGPLHVSFGQPTLRFRGLGVRPWP